MRNMKSKSARSEIIVLFLNLPTLFLPKHDIPTPALTQTHLWESFNFNSLSLLWNLSTKSHFIIRLTIYCFLTILWIQINSTDQNCMLILFFFFFFFYYWHLLEMFGVQFHTTTIKQITQRVTNFFWFSNVHKSYVYTISSVQLFSHVWLFVTPWTAAHQASLSITKLLEFT